MADSVEVTEHVAAPADVVYALVADLPKMGEYSPECYRCSWMGGATEARVGARFRGDNRHGWRRWSTFGKVVVAEPGRELTFDVSFPVVGDVARWSYRFEPDADGAGCTVTERWEDRRNLVLDVFGRLALGVADRGEHNREGMRATLRRLKETAERQIAAS